MKELSIEEKANAYDNVRNKIAARFGSNVAQEIFSEYEESEDEKIRKELINFLQLPHPKFVGERKQEKWLVWLEKQGEKKLNPYSGISFEYNGHTWGMCARDGGVEILMDSELKAFVSLDKSFVYPIYPQPDLAPKEPKFKVGDWVVDKNGTVQQILSYKNGIYKHTNGYSSKMFEDEWRIWDITKYANDGDVLFAENFDNIGGCVFLFNGLDSWKFDTEGDMAIATGYCCTSITESGNTDFGIQGPDCIEIKRVHPATKSQRDLLFQKMHEAGYEWDAEKKELKKIEQRSIDECDEYSKIASDVIVSDNDKPKFKVKYANSEYNVLEIKEIAGVTFYGIEDEPNHIDYVKADNCEIINGGYGIKENGFSVPTKPIMFSEQNPAWSEYDMSKVQRICKYLDEAKKYYADITEVRDCMNWLKSLKDKYIWKPSNEQMEVLLSEVNGWKKGCPKQIVLESLYNDLKKLK